MANSYDVVVIGAGPGGEVGAIRAAQLGLKVALIEKNQHLGGTCLNVGCIPTKALLEAAKVYDKLQHVSDLGFSTGTIEYSWQKVMERKESIVDAQRKGLRFLMKKNKIDVYEGVGSFKNKTTITIKDSKNQTTEITSKFVLLATGSRVKELPFAKADHKNILTSDSILFIDHVPKTLAVIGGGVVGMEFASLFGRFGSNVNVIELAPQILPSEDPETVAELVKHLKKQNVVIETNTKLLKLADHGKYVTVSVEGKADRTFDKVLLSIGREPVTDNLALENVSLKPETGGYITVDKHYRSNVDNIFAIGDIIKTPALAHTASAEAIHAVEVMAKHNPPVIDYAANPNAIYTYPEIASIGITETQAKEKNTAYKTAKFPFAPLAKAKIEQATEGFIKIILDPKYHEILGVHIVGAKATELISEFVVAKVLESTVDEIGLAIHPHPTISETCMEAAHAAVSGAIHL